MKERSMNQFFVNVQLVSNRKHALPIPPLITASTDLNTLKQQHFSDHPFINEFSHAYQQPSQQQSDEVSQFHGRHKFDSHQSENERVKQTHDDIPPLENYFPVSHIDPPSNPLSMEQTRMRENTQLDIKIKGNQSVNFVSNTAVMAVNLYNSILAKKKEQRLSLYSKSSSQILKNILTSPLKLQLFLKYLQQQTNFIVIQNVERIPLAEEDRNQGLRQSLRSKSNEKHSQTENQNNKQIQKKKRSQQNLQILSCLLVKIRECSLKNGETIPQICMQGDQIDVRFESNKHEGNPKLVEKREKIMKLQEQYQRKEQLIQGIKYQYDKIINNYAQSLINMTKEQDKQNNEKEQQEQKYDMISNDHLQPSNSSDRHSLNPRLSTKSFKLVRKHTFGGQQFGLDSSEIV